MALDSRLIVRRGDFAVDAALNVADGEVVALLGPNGSGKSTLLSALAGLLPIEAGTVSVKGRLLTDTAAGIAVPAHRRAIGLLGQEPLLFPHLTVLQNVAFGPRARHRGAARAGSLAQEWLDAVGLTGFEHRRPSELSGGQQQRAAIARALAAEPDLLLLDEPLASLDVESASLIRTLLRERLSSTRTTTVLVTHDVVDAIVLADRVVILDGGRIADGGSPETVLGHPVSSFAASLAGLNLLRGTVTPEGSVAVVDTDGGERMFAGHAGALAAGSDAFVAFPRSAVSVREPETSRSSHAANSWTGSVALLEPAAGGIRIVLADDDVVAEVPSTEVFAHRLGAGSPVFLHVDPACVTVYATRRVPSDDARTLGGLPHHL